MKRLIMIIVISTLFFSLFNFKVLASDNANWDQIVKESDSIFQET